MDNEVEQAFKRFDEGERPWTLVEKDWYVVSSTGILYPLKYIWALVINDQPRSFNTRDARDELASRDYSIINIKKCQSDADPAPSSNFPKKPNKKVIITIGFERNPRVVREILKRANGKCESCRNDAPFLRAKDGKPYLEVHHKNQLSKGGDDTVENAIALCPNCHRREHFG